LNAGPILKKFNFSATCYIVSKKIGRTNEWDLADKVTQSKLMSNSEIKQWVDLGMDIGVNTQAHANLNEVNFAIAKKEVNNCKTDLEQIFNLTICDFCYPFGQYNEAIVKLIKGAGYTSATIMNRGRVNNYSNNLKLPRIPITHHTLPHLFLLKLLTNYEDKR